MSAWINLAHTTCYQSQATVCLLYYPMHASKQGLCDHVRMSLYMYANT